MINTPQFNLLTDPLLPVIRASGTTEWITLPEIMTGIDDDPVTALDYGRPDLAVAGLEMLIGIFSYLFGVRSEEQWRALWDQPPTAHQFRQRSAAWLPYFDLMGDGPRFLQSKLAFDKKRQKSKVPNCTIEMLFPDAPGENTIKRNADIYIKRGMHKVLSPAAVAVSLFSLQNIAPVGGQGRRQGTRAACPLTTLLEPTFTNGKQTLFHTIWAHVAVNAAAEDLYVLPRHFSWMNDRTTDVSGTPPTTQFPQFFGMPRLIYIVWEKMKGTCDLTGRPLDGFGARSFWQASTKNSFRYSGAQPHPLSPSGISANKENSSTFFYRHPPERMSIQNYATAFLHTETSKQAGAITHFIEKRLPAVRSDLSSLTLLAAGYACDQASMLSYTEARFPSFAGSPSAAETEEFLSTFIVAIDAMVKEMRSQLVTAMLRASARRDESARKRLRESARIDAAFHDALREAERPLFEAVHELELAYPRGQEATLAIKKRLFRTLRGIILRVFEDAVSSACGAHMSSTVTAHIRLKGYLNGNSKLGAKLYESLGLPPSGADTRHHAVDQQAHAEEVAA